MADTTTRRPRLTPEERVRAKQELEAAIARHKAPTGKQPEEVAPATVFDQMALNLFVDELRRRREALGMSLADVSERTAIDRASLNRLELRKNLNPTYGTLTRYATAVGKTLNLSLEEAVVESVRSVKR